MRKTSAPFYKSGRFYISIAGVIVAGILFLLLLDNVIMPAYTNYGEGVTVPNITRMSLEEAGEELEDQGLRYEVAEKRSNSAFPAGYVIDQNPTPSEIVKPNRKIYLTLNAINNPTVKVPSVEDLSLRNARIQLQNAGLQEGTISYESSRFKNTVLRQSIEAGKVVQKGMKVDLAVSDGLGENMVQIPDITGLRLAQAQQKLREAGLRIGETAFQPSLNVAPNVILDYTPKNQQILEGKALKVVISERPNAREQDESGAVLPTESDSTNNQN